MRRLVIVTLLVACQNSNDAPGFGSGGGTGGYGDDTGEELAEGAPVITDLAAAFNTYSGRQVLEVEVYYTDDPDDVDGGLVVLDMKIDDQPFEIAPLPIDGSTARVEDGAVLFSLGGANNTSIDTTVDYALEITLEDSAGNESNKETVEVDAL